MVEGVDTKPFRHWKSRAFHLVESRQSRSLKTQNEDGKRVRGERQPVKCAKFAGEFGTFVGLSALLGVTLLLLIVVLAWCCILIWRSRAARHFNEHAVNGIHFIKP